MKFRLFTTYLRALESSHLTCISSMYSPIYTAENFWCGSDESGTRTQKIVLITHLHVLFSTVLKDVKL